MTDMKSWPILTGALLLLILYPRSHSQYMSREFMHPDDKLPRLLDKAIFLSQSELNIEWKKGLSKFQKQYGELILDLELCEAVRLDLKRRVESYPENTTGALRKVFYLYANFTAPVLDSDGKEIAARHYCCAKQLRDDLYLFIMCGRSESEFKMKFYTPWKYVLTEQSKTVPKTDSGTKHPKTFEIGPVIPL
ncbi:unnamed protein product [Allacma fusca]|uniref:Uncharacterized protein n=1 Tax=Allacma fusca TaxID=39272 RepID=A0A8J2KR82_9HEXA|nr:unnamed protein product [Allacma fusca]